MHRSIHLLCAVIFLISSSFAAAQAPKNSGFKIPPGFEVTLYADDKLATDIFSLTIDAKGRVVVAGSGYIKILHDTNGDGKADKASLFADFPKSGAHGMYFDGNDLICNGDHGVRRLYDSDGDGKCDKVSPIWVRTENDTSHAANGIVRGPDGWYYLITGNDAGIGKGHINMLGSPVKNPNAGVVVRFSPDGKKREVLAHGFRNPYDLAFNHLGHMFTVDADGERVHNMPYYAPNRLFDIAQGMHHGWLLPGWRRGWSRPPYWPDSVERLVEVGRGSPTGVVAYRHKAFPERYRNGIFSLCWTFGRVYFYPMQRRGSTYVAKKEIFMETAGDVGFAPTDMAVGPNGDLFVSIGGRGTRGSVFRVHWKGPNQGRARLGRARLGRARLGRARLGRARLLPSHESNPYRTASEAQQELRSPKIAQQELRPPKIAQQELRPPKIAKGLRTVLSANQPLSSWSRARWVPQAKRLGKKPFLNALANYKLPLGERIRAVEVLTELFGGVPRDAAERLIEPKTDLELFARVIWSLSRRNSRGVGRFLVLLTDSPDPRIARAAWEALMSTPAQPSAEVLAKAKWKTGLDSKDRRVRAAAIATALGRGREGYRKARERYTPSTPRQRLAELWIQGLPTTKEFFQNALKIATDKNDPRVRLEAARLLQIALGDVNTDEEKVGKAFVGYIARSVGRMPPQLRNRAAKELALCLPSGDEPLDMELARLLGMLHEDVPGLLKRTAGKWTKKSVVQNDVHYLLTLSQLPGKRSSEVTRQTANALITIHSKLAAKGGKFTDQVPEIFETLFARLLRLDPALGNALVVDPAFGFPEHVIYINKLPSRQKQLAVPIMLAKIAKMNQSQARQAWTPNLMRLVDALPAAESLPILRRQFDDPRLTDTIALLLSSHCRPEDRGRFVNALDSSQPGVVKSAAGALLKLDAKKPKSSPQEIGRAVRALRRLQSQKTGNDAKKALAKLLVHWAGQRIGKDNAADRWVSWFTKTYPTIAAKLPGLTSTTFATWKKRLSKINWPEGNVQRGKLVFQKQNCFRCHGSHRRLGPDLKGAAQRFSRDDLFTAIIDPNKDISPAYRPTNIITKSGKVYTGVLIYQSPALTLLQTTPDTTVRIPRKDLHLTQPGATSFMPNALLDNASDTELADLYAYLKSLR